MKDAEEVSNRTEPVWFTTADLIALVIGCSLALATPWHNSPTAQISFSGGLMPPSFAYLVALDELIRKACLALVPVLVARRARFVGRRRSLEFLVAFCAVTQVVMAVERLPWRSSCSPPRSRFRWRGGREAARSESGSSHPSFRPDTRHCFLAQNEGRPSNE